MAISQKIPGPISQRFKELRKSAGIRSSGLSLEDVSAATGISTAVLSHIENRSSKNPSFTNVMLLCRLYGLHPCGLTTLYPMLDSRMERAIEHFWTVLNDEERFDIAGQIELLVAKHIDAGDLRSAIVEGGLDMSSGEKRKRNHRC